MTVPKKWQTLFDYVTITLGVFLLAVSISMFFQPLNIVTGGVSGIGIIVEEMTNGLVPVWLTNLLLNVPLLLIGLKLKGLRFLIRTLYATVMLSVWLFITENFFPPIQNLDLFVAGAIGGVLLGVGLGLVMRSNGTTGGSDLLAIIIKHFKPEMEVATLMFIIEAVIIASGLMVFGFIEACYAMLAIVIQTEFLNIVLEGVSNAKAAFIVTDEAAALGEVIVHDLDRAATIMDSMGAYRKVPNNVVLCVTPKKKLVDLRKAISKVDPNAFLIVADVREVYGEGFDAHFADERLTEEEAIEAAKLLDEVHKEEEKKKQ